jgi:hypothetical protein
LTKLCHKRFRLRGLSGYPVFTGYHNDRECYAGYAVAKINYLREEVFGMKKKLSFMSAFLVATLIFGSMTASAMSIQFNISKSDGAVWVASNTKDLSGSNFQISNMNTSYSNFVEDADVIGFRVKNPAGTVSYSGYHTFSKFVYRYSLPYTTTPATSASLRLNAQVDSAGQYNNVQYEGEWIS